MKAHATRDGELLSIVPRTSAAIAAYPRIPKLRDQPNPILYAPSSWQGKSLPTGEEAIRAAGRVTPPVRAAPSPASMPSCSGAIQEPNEDAINGSSLTASTRKSRVALTRNGMFLRDG